VGAESSSTTASCPPDVDSVVVAEDVSALFSDFVQEMIAKDAIATINKDFFIFFIFLKLLIKLNVSEVEII
jgi:hypothetical protein